MNSDHDPERSPAQDDPGTAATRPRVLVVDDQAMVTTALQQLLPDADLLACNDPTRALAVAQDFQPSVILQDLVMPGIDGITLMRYYRAHPSTAQVPVVMLSSNDDPAVKARAFEAGADDYLVKIPEGVELRARIRYHSRNYRVLQERDAATRKLEASLLELEQEQARSESLLLNVLPASIAERLKTREGVIADRYPAATVLFADLVGFTAYAATRDPIEVVGMLNEVFSGFDQVVTHHGGEKIKTIGDAYMVVAGVPDRRPDHARVVGRIGLELLEFIRHFNTAHSLGLQVRVGAHSGPVVAGIIGRSKFAYDLWGATVNLASRMESAGIPSRFQVTQQTARLLGDEFLLSQRGPIQAKGVGMVDAWFVNGWQG